MMPASHQGRPLPIVGLGSLVWCLILIVSLPTPAVAAQDAVAEWLESRGLDRLRMSRLEEMLASSRVEEEQDVLIEQLIELYVRAFDSDLSDEERSLLENRGERLLKGLKITTGDPLRLVLLRSRYALAESDCLELRLQRRGAVDRASMAARLEALAFELGELRLRLEKRNDSQKRKLGRTRGIDAELLSRDTVTIDVMLGQATYLEAWVRAYLGWLTNASEESDQSQRLFGTLFDTGETYPEPGSLSLDRRSFDWYAWSIIGTAFARSLRDSMPTLESWLDLLLEETAAERPSAWLPFWRLALALDLRDYRTAARVLSEASDDATSEMLRLASVVALQAPDDAEAATLARMAVDRLASRGDFKLISELSERFGLPDVKEGFLLRFVGAWQLMRDAEARAEEGDEGGARQLNREALAELNAAESQSDAADFPELRLELLRMRGLCHRLTGDHLSAGEDFLAASEAAGGRDAGDLLWSAIQSFLEHERSAAVGADQVRFRMALLDRFLVLHPSHPRVSRARLLSMEDASDPTIDDALELLALAEDDELAEVSRKKALGILYRLFKSGQGSTSVDAGRVFLDRVSLPNFSSDMTEEEIDASLLESLRILSVSLAERTREPAMAVALMAAIDDAHEQAMRLPERHLGAQDSRRVEDLLLPPLEMQDLMAAIEVVAGGAGIESDPHVRRSLKLILATCERQLQTDSNDSPLVNPSIDAIRRAVAGLIGPDPLKADLTESETWLILRAMAMAERIAHEQTRDFETGERAFALHDALVRSRPNDSRVLHGLVRVAEATGRLEAAVNAQRVLLNGASPGTDIFFERKSRFLELLFRHDPERARKVLDQHVVLYPDYGPGPWGEVLRRIHDSLQGGSS